ncbi:VOC family protein [Lampropedia puyangensis]|uniref:Bleomycin resistance protein n=1 Tax=Lampropedia puyangensis TaxID=1330072 RepID=A0A4S8F6X1_9BURK|nr:glyoxalase superfamily protein [Lampropedia puyangensis]THU02839.1 VOC family protein [Lampropedia puyangensis]
MTAVIPILRSFDEAKAREFYVDFLGFQIDWEHRFEANFPLYWQLSLAGCVLHLSEHHGDASPGAHVRVAEADVDALRQTLIAKDYRYAKPEVRETPWGNREMTIADPFGNRLTFYTEGKALSVG